MKTTLGILLLFAVTCYGEITSIQNLPNLPNLNDLVPSIKEKCEKKGGKGTYENIEKVGPEVKTCLDGLINFETLKQEVEESKKTGSMDEVFGKYCKKRPQIRACIQKGIDAVTPCLDDNEKSALNITLNILKELGEFVCYRDGDRIAMFVAEGGVDCLKDHLEGVQQCVNSTLKLDSSKLTKLTPNSIPKIDKTGCDDLSKVQTCVVAELEKCKDSTPANIVDALFRFIKKSACDDKKPKRSVFKREVNNAISENQVQFKAVVVEKVKTYCNEYGKGEAFIDLKDSLIKSRTCTGNFLDIFGGQQDVRIAKCYSDTVTKIENCLPEELKYFPGFVVDVLQSVTQFLRDNMQNFKLSSTNMVFQQCFMSLKQENSKKAFMECLNDSNLGDSSNQIYTKDVTCRKLKELAACASNVIRITCIPDINLDKFRDGLEGAFTKPCRSE